MGETELGLRSLAWIPALKAATFQAGGALIGALQDLCEGEPGYVGRDEMHEDSSGLQKANW